ncbi:MAG: hypothetical protein Q4P24_16795 [Rhodobacterales bacterium]|nr:hypothetical protein [Rhodobacterales bacterium]
MTKTAFGAPGIRPTWTSSDKDFVTTGLGRSRLWATIGHGVLNEVYWPSTGQPRLRDVTFYLVGYDRWLDLKRIRQYRLSQPGPAIPLVTVTHEGADYTLELEFLPDPDRDALLVRYRLTGAYALVMIAAPHLDGAGTCAHAWVDGELFAVGGGGTALCVASSDGFVDTSVGFVGESDGWQDLSRHGRLTYAFRTARNGNVALTARLPHKSGELALAFSNDIDGARTLARSALSEGCAPIRDAFIAGWQDWNSALAPLADIAAHAAPPDLAASLHGAGLLSATVLKTHEDRNYVGALVASLSMPWGSSGNTLGGYHLVWPRDTTLAAFAFIAINQCDDALRILTHLIATQLDDGHWAQNFYPSGAAFWTGEQLDEAAFPVLLAAKLRELGHAEPHGTGRMVRRNGRMLVMP